MRVRSYRRHQAACHQRRRLSEDRNKHYDDLRCSCWHDPKAIARFCEQPQLRSCPCCGNPCKWEKGAARLTLQERRWMPSESPDIYAGKSGYQQTPSASP